MDYSAIEFEGKGVVLRTGENGVFARVSKMAEDINDNSLCIECSIKVDGNYRWALKYPDDFTFAEKELNEKFAKSAREFCILYDASCFFNDVGRVFVSLPGEYNKSQTLFALNSFIDKFVEDVLEHEKKEKEYFWDALERKKIIIKNVSFDAIEYSVETHDDNDEDAVYEIEFSADANEKDVNEFEDEEHFIYLCTDIPEFGIKEQEHYITL